ncbi:MAG: HD domain-containing protein, partial [Oscillospiraceae bacterium]|nr:HD domain-containing protein [Oscillospiraceae bacterium]
ENVNADILVTACLLHDIARAEQFADAKVDHAAAGAVKARAWLLENDFAAEFAETVSECVHTHRYRSDNPPRSLEAKILFDADKVDVCGATGIARTLFYKGHTSEPLYAVDANGKVSDGTNDKTSTFFREYTYKLENIYDRFYTKRGSELARKRREAALLAEVRECYENGGLQL